MVFCLLVSFYIYPPFAFCLLISFYIFYVLSPMSL
jgi:hypothetical protein